MLSRAIQVSQVARDSAHMFFDGVDFSVTGNQQVIGRLGLGMGLASDSLGTIDTNGNGVVILTQMLMVGDAECTAGGYPSGTTCPNRNQLVIEKRIVIGNTARRSSSFGSPSVPIQADGSILPSDYCTDASAVVTAGAPPNNLGLASGQYTYGVESYFIMPELMQMLAHDSYSYILM